MSVKIRLTRILCMVLLITMVVSGLSYTAYGAEQTTKGTAEVKMLPGDLIFTQVPSFNFIVNTEKQQGGYHSAVGAISGNFVIEDARTTGKSWTLKVSMGELTNQFEKDRKVSDVTLSIGAPVAVSTAATSQGFKGYPTELTTVNEFKTIAVSGPTGGKIAIWEGKIPSVEISMPVMRREKDKYIAALGSTYKAAMYWSIEDTP